MLSIVGAGVAGLVLGQLLRKRQIPAVIWEKSKHYPNLQNFGITLQPRAYRPLLRALDIDEAAFHREAVIKPIDGNVELHDTDNVRVNRSKLLDLLAKDLDVRWSHKLDSIDKGSERRHKLIFTNENGKKVMIESETIIAADGVHSAVRNSLGLSKEEFDFTVLPFVVYNGKRTFASGSLPEGLEKCLIDPAGLTLVKDDMVLKITSGYHDEQANEVAINYTLSRNAGAEDEALLKREKSDAETLAKQILREAEQLGSLEEPFKTVFDADKMREDRLLHWLMRSAVIDLEVVMRHAKQGILIIGDAANPTPIIGGAGANNAMISALQLVDLLNSNSSCKADILREMHGSWLIWKSESEQALRDTHTVGAPKAVI